MMIWRVGLRSALATGTLALILLAGCSLTGDSLDCDTNSCSITLKRNGAKVDLPVGPKISLDSVDGGKASITVGDQSYSCAEGETFSAGPVTLACTSVTDDSVKLSASF